MPDSLVNDALTEASAAAERAYVARTPESRRAHEAACEHLPGGNTRTVLHYSPYPLRIQRAEGARMWDVDGHDYADFLGEYSAGLFGHSQPQIMAAAREVLDDGILFGGPTTMEATLATLICARFASCDQVRFCNSGTEANLLSLGAARAHTGRDKVLVMNGGYHGGVLFFGPNAERINAPFDWVLGRFNDLDATLDAVSGQEHEIAAILVEPMCGVGGGIPATAEFLQGLRDFADRHGIVLIFDEVMTSRHGPGGLQGELGIVPDMTSFGKYVGGGFTIGAFGGRTEIMRRFDPREPDALPHAGTFNNNVVSMAAGIVGLRDIFTADVARSHMDRGTEFIERLQQLGAARQVPVQVTGTGTILGVHFQETPIERPGDAAATRPEARTLFHLEMLARGQYASRRGFMSLSLALEEADYDSFAAAFDDVIATHADAFRCTD